MSLADKQLLVTGASGNLGKAIVAELRLLGAKKVIAATRTPGKLQELTALGVEEREADFDRPETLRAAFRGVERLLLVSTDSLHAPNVRINSTGQPFKRRWMLLSSTLSIHRYPMPIRRRNRRSRTIISGRKSLSLRAG